MLVTLRIVEYLAVALQKIRSGVAEIGQLCVTDRVDELFPRVAPSSEWSQALLAFLSPGCALRHCQAHDTAGRSQYDN